MTEFSTIHSDQIHCDYFPLCSGCSIQKDVIQPFTHSVVVDFFKSIDPSLSPPLLYQDIVGWRIRSKLAVRGNHLNPDIGLFKKGTHDVLSIPHCPLHHSSINEAYQHIRNQMISLKVEPYCEKKRTGMIRYLQFVVAKEDEKVQISLVVNCDKKNIDIDRFVKQLYSQKVFSGIWINYQSANTNRIFGDRWELGAGEPYLWEKILGNLFAFHPACFVQAHLQMFESMLKSIQSSIISNCRVVEFYSGIGVIGLSMASRSNSVICSEVNSFAQECFHFSVSKLDPSISKKVSFVLGDADQLQYLLDDAEVVIVDPPRKGIDPHLMKSILASSHLKQLIYVSCGFESFKKDCIQLLEKGWKIEKAEAYLFFPGTQHLEVLAIFRFPARESS